MSVFIFPSPLGNQNVIVFHGTDPKSANRIYLKQLSRVMRKQVAKPVSTSRCANYSSERFWYKATKTLRPPRGSTHMFGHSDGNHELLQEQFKLGYQNYVILIP